MIIGQKIQLSWLIMNCLSITSHYYACKNWIVKHLITRIMICLRPSLMSNDLIRGSMIIMSHPQITLYVLDMLRIIG
jgi:hypothetical protein